MKQFLTALVASACVCVATVAQNPVICDRYTPDPAPYVHGDTLYLFVDHDENQTLNGYFTMKDWLLYSTVDMVNWTYRGTPVTTATFKSWAKQDNDAWAAQCIERNGKWYWYCTATVANGGYPGVGVAVADNPAGPYKDLIKKPLVKGWGFIDPTVFIDDDGQAYLFWGNNGLWYAKLRSNMMTLNGDYIEVKTKDEVAFGPYKGYNDDGSPKTNYEEAPWVYKIGDTYYLEYAAGGVPEHWAYATAKNIAGPWTYQGKVMGEAKGSFTIHGGSVDFKGHSYMFYHDGRLPNGGGYHRATCVEEFTRGADGSIPFIPFTSKGVEPIAAVNPFVRQEAETINQSSGVLCVGDGTTNYVTNITTDGYIKVRNVDFGDTPVKTFKARLTPLATKACYLYIRLDSKGGKTVAKVKVPASGDAAEWTEFETEVLSNVTGVHDLYFTFAGGAASDKKLFDFDCWQFGLSAEETAIDSPMTDERRDGEVYTLDGKKVGDSRALPRNSIMIDHGKKRLGK